MIRYATQPSPPKVTEWLNARSDIQVVSITYNPSLARYVIFYEDNPKVTIQVENPVILPSLQDVKPAPPTCRPQTACTQVALL